MNEDREPVAAPIGTTPSRTGELRLGHLLAAAGIEDLSTVQVLRHTFNPEGLRDAADLTPERVLAYTRTQVIGSKFPKSPPSTWLVFVRDISGRHCRFLWAYDNQGEVSEERTDRLRSYDLHPSPVLSALQGRLVVEWTRDAINWTKSGARAADLPVVEIADPDAVPFPGFDHVLLTYDGLRAVVSDPRYAAWQTALQAVQGIYLIADTSTGKLYVGKADGRERILGRWTTYARDGHGGNVGLGELADVDADYARRLQFSLLRVFDPGATKTEVDAAESHFKRAMLTRRFGLNRN